MRSRKPIYSKRIAASCLTFGALLTAAAPALATNKAFAARWPALVDTDIAFSTFFGSNHTIAFWYMPQYPFGYAGPVITSSTGSGKFWIGQGVADVPGGEVAEPSDTRLVMKINNVSTSFDVELAWGTWHHIAVVRDVFGGSTRFRLFVDGAPKCGLDLAGCDYQPSGTLPVPGGFIRIGRTNLSSPTELKTNNQTYGLVDDVAVFNTALSAAAIGTLFANRVLSGNEAGLLAGVTFDTPLPGGVLAHAPTAVNEIAPYSTVTDTRDSTTDNNALPGPHPFYSGTINLPFKPGQAWKIVQPWARQGNASHHGGSAFAIDWVLAGEETPNKPSNPNGSADSCGEPVFAQRRAQLAVDDYGKPPMYDDGKKPAPQPPQPDDDWDEQNYAKVRAAYASWDVYMHLFTDSVDEVYRPFWIPGLNNPPFFGLVDGPVVSVGRQIGRVGTKNGCHLHTSTNTGGNPDLATHSNYPIGYSNYEECWSDCGWEDCGPLPPNQEDCVDPADWQPVSFGVPKGGNWLVRNMVQ